MNNPLDHCGMMDSNAINLCQPLQTLKNAHIPLRAQMELLNEASNKIGNDSSITNWKTQIINLKTEVISFVQELEPHSEREEGILFPMMSSYIGRQAGPIVVMEFEHEQAKLHLKNFLEKTSHLNSEVSGIEAKSIASLVIQAYLILTEHFMKEENVLFPMAERMLSAEEKIELAQKIMAVS